MLRWGSCPDCVCVPVDFGNHAALLGNSCVHQILSQISLEVARANLACVICKGASPAAVKSIMVVGVIATVPSVIVGFVEFCVCVVRSLDLLQLRICTLSAMLAGFIAVIHAKCVLHVPAWISDLVAFVYTIFPTCRAALCCLATGEFEPLCHSETSVVNSPVLRPASA